jgi:hypothetical protein
VSEHQLNTEVAALLEVAKQLEKVRFVLEKMYGRMEVTNERLEEIGLALQREEPSEPDE